MRNWLLTAPWWVHALLLGSVYGLGNVLTGRFLGDGSWTEAVVSGVVVGALFGAVVGPLSTRMNRRLREPPATPPATSCSGSRDWPGGGRCPRTRRFAAHLLVARHLTRRAELLADPPA